jgi:hypothetical protein
MDDFDYKKYSLQKLEDWVCDAISSAEATPEEVYNTILGAIAEYHEHHKKGFNYTTELLSLLKGNRPVDFEDEAYEAVKKEYEYYEGSDVSGVNDCMPPWGHSDMEALLQQKEDKIVRWQLPTEVDGLTGDVFVTFPDDLLEASGLNEGDTIEWVDRGDGSYLIRKVTNPLGPDEC